MTPTQRQAALAKASGLATAGKFSEALGELELLRRSLPELGRRDADLQHLAGFCLMHLGQSPSADQCFKLTLMADPGRTRARVDYAALLRRDGQTAEALAQLDAALAREPGSDEVIRSKADLLMDMGRYAQAGVLLGPLVERCRKSATPDPGVALTFARYALMEKREAEALELLDAAVKTPGMPPLRERIVHRRRGEMLDRLGRYDEAFAAFRASHEVSRESWDPDAFSARVDRVIAAWTPDAAWGAPLVKPALEWPRFIFIVGMMRSGTSLVEQILGAVPGVFAAGERQELHGVAARLDRPPAGQRAMLEHPEWFRESTLKEGAAWYAGQLESARSTQFKAPATHVIDKNPSNFFYLPLIARMLPRSKVIWCRRDPYDVCLSNYFQTFTGMHPEVHDLEHLGRYHRDHDRLMLHWRTIAADLGLELAEVPYERLVADVEAEARRLVSFAGLAWNEACLRFHENERAARTASNDQVRRPIYTTSLKRHERYAAHLGPLRRGLGASVP